MWFQYAWMARGVFVGVMALTLLPSPGWCEESVPEAAASPLASSPVDRSTTAIPFELLRSIVSSSNRNQFGLTPEQIEAMNQLHQTHLQGDRPVWVIGGFLAESPIRTRRYQAAFQQIQQDRQEVLRQQWLAIVTPEQQTSIRRRSRQAIQQAKQNRLSSVVYDDQTPIDGFLSNHDLLSLLERPSIQDKLELTDEQLQIVEQQTAVADQDAIRTIKTALEKLSQPEIAAEPHYPMIPAHVTLLQEVRKVLTDEQWDQYQKRTNDPQRSMELIQKLGFDKARPLIEPHGAVSQSITRSTDGKVTVEVTLRNAFDNEQTIAELKLTPEQQAQIQAQLEAAKPEIETVMTQFEEERLRRNNERKAILNDLLSLHNERVNTPLADLLTPQQTAQLEQQRYRGLGLYALRNPQVIEKLGLTPQQTETIAAAFQTPGPKPPQMQPVTRSEDFQKASLEFRKQSEEYGKLAREHWMSIERQITAQLSEEQNKRFIELTGHVYQSQAPGSGSTSAIQNAAKESGEKPQ